MKTLSILSIALVLCSAVFADFDQSYVDNILKQAEDPMAKNYACPVQPTYPKATSVHQLRPADIQVIGAIGDSLTAANGAKAMTILGLLDECRGVSWSMGGEGTVYNTITLANILRQFNPNLVGFSTGTGKYTNVQVAGFNLANPGDTSHDMMRQAIDLVARIKSASNVNFNNDWKLITFFVGGNDLCKYCNDRAKYTANNYITNVKNVLNYLKANLPRALVNMVVTLDVRGIEVLTGLTCRNMQGTLCLCGLDPANTAELIKLTDDIQKGTEDLVLNGNYDTNEFAVVLQPFMKKMTPPLKPDGSPDFGMFAPDCFHFNLKGHAAAALELWNSMLTPYGRKPERWVHIGGTAKCPTTLDPYIFTHVNSRSANLRDLILKNGTN